ICEPARGIRKTPDATLMLPGPDQGVPGYRAGPGWRDDGQVNEATGVQHDRGHFRRPGPLSWLRGPAGGGPLRRRRDDHLAGGVAAGLAARTGFDVTVVRIVFVLATLASGGFAVAVYVLAWLLVPLDGADGNIAGKARSDRRGITLAAGLGSLLAVVLLLATTFGIGWLGWLSWPLVISAAG